MPRRNESATAWNDWGSVNPLFAILTDPQYRHGTGSLAEFFESGEAVVANVLAQCAELGLARHRGRALDFGCGVGRLTAPLAGRFESVLGLDVADTMIEQARQHHQGLPHCQFQVHHDQDLQRLDDQSMDFVLCLLVLQHLESAAVIGGYLAEFVRVLRPGGALVFQIPTVVAPVADVASWRTADGRRRRTAVLLRRAGVSASVLYRRLDWVPEMTMLGIPDSEVRSLLEARDARIVVTSEPDVDRGGTESRVYFVTRDV